MFVVSPSNNALIVLASASPRRSEILDTLAIAHVARPAHIDETPRPGESPADYVLRMAETKARSIVADLPVLGADTTVTIDDEILGKPTDEADFHAMISKLSGRVHEVLTAVAVAAHGAVESRLVTSRVHFRDVDRTEAARYWASGEPADKAGGYGIQGIGGIFARRIEGSYSAVVGLPTLETEALLARVGVDTWRARFRVE